MDDTTEIRKVIEDWLKASKAGDLPALLRLMDEKVVFLATGQKPMRGRDAFAEAFKKGAEYYSFAATSEVDEIEAMGDWAYASTSLHLSIIPHDKRIPKAERSGPTLSIYKRQPDGHWAIYRDANMLMVEAAAKAGPWVKNPSAAEHL